jgi:hypothetical protein
MTGQEAAWPAERTLSVRGRSLGHPGTYHVVGLFVLPHAQ